MHEESLKSIQNKIRDIIKSLKFDTNYNISFSATSPLDALKKEVVKCKTLNLNERDILSIVFTPVIERISEITNEQNQSEITFENTDIDLLVNKITNVFSRLPEKYLIKIDIPLFSGTTPVAHENISISYLPKILHETNCLSKLMRIEKSREHCLMMTIEGFLDNLYDETYKNILSYIKVLVQRGFAKKIYLKCSPSLNNYISTELISQKNQKTIPHYVIKFKSKEQNEDYKTLVLSDEINIFLNNLEINSDNLQDATFYNLLIECHSIISGKNESIKSISSAIEWCFDAYTQEERNISMAFLYLCFGLEALFTEKKKNNDKNELSITQTLAIKCSYLISNSADEREIIKKKDPRDI